MKPGICQCSHPDSDHWNGKGSCMVSTSAVTWACTCTEYREALDPEDTATPDRHGGYYLVMDLVGGPGVQDPAALVGTYIPITDANGKPIEAEVLEAEARLVSGGRRGVRVRLYSAASWYGEPD